MGVPPPDVPLPAARVEDVGGGTDKDGLAPVCAEACKAHVKERMKERSSRQAIGIDIFQTSKRVSLKRHWYRSECSGKKASEVGPKRQTKVANLPRVVHYRIRPAILDHTNLPWTFSNLSLNIQANVTPIDIHQEIITTYCAKVKVSRTIPVDKTLTPRRAWACVAACLNGRGARRRLQSRFPHECCFMISRP